MTAEEDDTLHKSDPLKWQALRGCDFAEAIPVSEFKDALGLEAFMRMRAMAKFIRRETGVEEQV